MRLLNFTIEIEDSDFVEHQWREWLKDNIQPKHVKTLKNADHIKDDKHYRKLLKMKKDAQYNLDKYIDSKR